MVYQPNLPLNSKYSNVLNALYNTRFGKKHSKIVAIILLLTHSKLSVSEINKLDDVRNHVITLKMTATQSEIYLQHDASTSELKYKYMRL